MSDDAPDPLDVLTLGPEDWEPAPASPPITITIDFDTPAPGQSCHAVPCSHCGACSVCMDFHGNAYGGCTDETCPFKKGQADER